MALYFVYDKKYTEYLAPELRQMVPLVSMEWQKKLPPNVNGMVMPTRTGKLGFYAGVMVDTWLEAQVLAASFETKYVIDCSTGAFVPIEQEIERNVGVRGTEQTDESTDEESDTV